MIMLMNCAILQNYANLMHYFYKQISNRPLRNVFISVCLNIMKQNKMYFVFTDDVANVERCIFVLLDFDENVNWPHCSNIVYL